VGDIERAESLAAELNAVTVKVGRDRDPVDPEAVGQGIDGLALLVSLHQFGDLLRRKLRCGRPPGLRCVIVVAISSFWQTREPFGPNRPVGIVSYKVHTRAPKRVRKRKGPPAQNAF
jgi:hypothetical protein